MVKALRCFVIAFAVWGVVALVMILNLGLPAKKSTKEICQEMTEYEAKAFRERQIISQLAQLIEKKEKQEQNIAELKGLLDGVEEAMNPNGGMDVRPVENK